MIRKTAAKIAYKVVPIGIRSTRGSRHWNTATVDATTKMDMIT